MVITLSIFMMFKISIQTNQQVVDILLDETKWNSNFRSRKIIATYFDKHSSRLRFWLFDTYFMPDEYETGSVVRKVERFLGTQREIVTLKFNPATSYSCLFLSKWWHKQEIYIPAPWQPRFECLGNSAREYEQQSLLPWSRHWKIKNKLFLISMKFVSVILILRGNIRPTTEYLRYW